MKILVASCLAIDTGSAVRAENIAKSLKKTGFEVQFLKPFPKSLPFKIDLLISLPWYFLRILTSSCNVIFAVKSYPNLGIPIFFKKLMGAKIIFDTDDLAFAYTKGLWSRVSRILQEAFLPLADLHTCHNVKLLDYLTGNMKISKKKIFQLHQGVDLEIFGKKISTGEVDKLRKKLGLERKKVLVFVGHFDVACDLDAILKAMTPVFKNIPETRLLLVGDGENKRKFQSLAQRFGILDKTIWVGLVPQEKVIDYLELSDACLVYYKNRKANHFRVSLKLREYLAAGKRVVCNDIGDLKDFRKYTYQTSSRFPEFTSMVNKVLLGFDDKRQEKGRLYVHKNFSWDKISKDFGQKIRREFDKKAS